MSQYLKHSLYLFLLCFSYQVEAQEIVTLDKFDSPMNVASYGVYIDTILNFEEVVQLPDSIFSKIKSKDFGKGFLAQREFWIKLSLKYRGEVDIKRVVTSPFSKIDTISYYLLRGDSLFQYKKGGNSISYLSNDYNYKYPLFELSLPPQFKGDLFIHLKPKSFVFFPMEFWEPKALAFKTQNNHFKEGLITGILVLFLISVIVFALIFKEKYFWFYGLYLFSFIIFLASYHGNFWSWIGFETAGLHNIMFDPIVGICFVLFSRAFFDLKKNYPLTNKLLSIFILIEFTSFILQSYINSLSAPVLQIKVLIDSCNILGVFLFNFFILYVTYKTYKKNKQTRYLWIFFSILIFFIGATFTNLYLMGIYNPGTFINAAIPLLILLETVILFGVIALDYFEIKTKKNKVDIALSIEKQNALGNLVRGAEQERERLAGELHDGVGGIMVALKLQFEQFKSSVTPEESKNFKKLLEQSTKEIKSISYNLMPSSLTLTSLTESLEELCQLFRIKKGTTIEFYAPNWDDNLSKEHKLGIYRIVQELLKNIIEHSEASEVIVQISRYGQRIHLIVEDTGIGFDESEITAGIGLSNIRNRLSYLNGKLEIESYQNRGTTFNIIINL